MSYVIPDIKPFRDTSGKVIEGRRQWREHLKDNDLVELGHDDIKRSQSIHEKKRNEIAEKTGKFLKDVVATHDIPLPQGDEARKRLYCKVAERLEGRDPPPRKVLLKIVMEEVRREKRS